MWRHLPRSLISSSIICPLYIKILRRSLHLHSEFAHLSGPSRQFVQGFSFYLLNTGIHKGTISIGVYMGALDPNSNVIPSFSSIRYFLFRKQSHAQLMVRIEIVTTPLALLCSQTSYFPISFILTNINSIYHNWFAHVSLQLSMPFYQPRFAGQLHRIEESELTVIFFLPFLISPALIPHVVSVAVISLWKIGSFTIDARNRSMFCTSPPQCAPPRPAFSAEWGIHLLRSLLPFVIFLQAALSDVDL